MFILYAIVFIIILYVVLDYCRHVSAREAMLKSLRRENTMLVHKNMSLDENNLALRRNVEALEKQLSKSEALHVMKEEQAADTIAKLEAEIRLKDKMLEQKWKTARTVCEVV